MSEPCKTQLRYSSAVCQGKLKGHSDPHNYVEPDGTKYAPPAPPTLDEKIEAVAEQLHADAKAAMEWILDSGNVDYYFDQARTRGRIITFRY